MNSKVVTAIKELVSLAYDTGYIANSLEKKPPVPGHPAWEDQAELIAKRNAAQAALISMLEKPDMINYSIEQ